MIPYRNFRFRIEIGGITQAGFQDCTFGNATVEPVEYREGPDATTPRKLSGQTKYSNITLKWGLTDSTELYDWHRRVVETGAASERQNISIVLIDEEGNDKSRWEVVQAWPTNYDPSDFAAKGSEVAIETLEIVTEGFTRVS